MLAPTKEVQKRELELGDQLVYRERQLTQLAELGKEVLPMPACALASAEAVAHKFQRKEVATEDGLTPSISASLALDPVAEIAKFVPLLHVEPREGAAEKLVDLVLEGEINAAMVGDVQDMPVRIDDWSLFEERYVPVLAPTHWLANRPSIGMDDLRDTILLERADCDVAPKSQQSYFPEKLPHLGYFSGHDLHLQYMAAAGFGVILVPEHMPRFRRSRPFRSKATRFRGRRGCWLCRGAATRRRWTLSSRSRGFAIGRSKSPPGHAARNDPGGVTTTRTPAGNRLQPIDPQTDALLMPNRQDIRSDSHRAVDDVQRRGLGVMQPPRGLAARYRRDIARIEGRRRRAGSTSADMISKAH